MPAIVPDYQTLSAMITPAIFLTANGSLIISTSNRMSRVVDRIRAVTTQSDALCRGKTDLDFVDDRLAHNSDQLGRLVWRGDRIRLALVALYLAFASFVGTSLGLAVDILFEHRAVALPTGLAVVGVCLLLVACIQLVREALEALRSNRLEVDFFRQIEARRRSADRPASP
ncbi:DUF2721 domain-containing protein [Tautonia plasticadhaerens]|uniref:DUF2721 domain-containing protein n=1 Tax=Tautonia plasticadhaerens TaxID=2527974 RepID=A0A518GV41_9BACT|nr:DUF2721 domain-containing protein [Tautonia plasticadhaerens]QDV32448.1 hypothetical protein ElP_02800 [Tautonia plasticadhaerens]